MMTEEAKEKAKLSICRKICDTLDKLDEGICDKIIALGCDEADMSDLIKNACLTMVTVSILISIRKIKHEKEHEEITKKSIEGCLEIANGIAKERGYFDD